MPKRPIKYLTRPSERSDAGQPTKSAQRTGRRETAHVALIATAILILLIAVVGYLVWLEG
jgi:hypothetical protein